MRLRGKIAAITGAARNGLGRAIAIAFAREGADIAVLDIRPAHETLEPIRGIGRRTLGIQVDAGDPDRVAAALERVTASLGPLDVLVNGTAIIHRKPVLDLTVDDWDSAYRINLRSYFVTSQWTAKDMIRRGRGGSIINIASISGINATRDLAHYCAMKGGVIMLTRCMAVELAPRGIRVNAISPGAFETDINRELLSDPAFRKTRTDPVPLGRLGLPHEVAGVAVLLASGEGSFLVGAKVHFWGANILIIMVLIHMARVYWTGSYRAPRELNWMVGVIMLLCILGLSLTGYLLPWDTKAYFATEVTIKIAGSAPPAALGAFIKEVLQGGPVVGPPTLQRFFTIHVFLLPAVITLLMYVHFRFIRAHGISEPM